MRTTKFFLMAVALMFFLYGCQEPDTGYPDNETTTTTTIFVDDTAFEPTDWTEDTHSKSADPNFSEVFDYTTVKRFDIVVTSERWQNMLDDMTDLYGSFGGIFGGRPGGQVSSVEELTDAGFCVKKTVTINNLPVRYLKKFGIIGVYIDIFISNFLKKLSDKKANYLLAVCTKK